MEACDCDAYEKNQYGLSSRQNERDLSKMMRDSIGCKPPAYQNLMSQMSSVPVRPIWSFGGFNEWKPKHLSYCKESSRMSSFNTWPKQMNPKPEQLAKAGFFYEGVSDTCRCFFCGHVVHNLETHDDALEEHRRHSPKCHYVEFHM